MAMLLLTGDLHGPIDIHKLTSKNFPFGKTLTKNDLLIVTGDFGLVWSTNENDKEERYWLNWLNNKPWTTLFVDGNHENFDRLNKLPVINMFGGTVGVVHDSIFHLKRGEIYEIEGKKIFTFGGATSTDKENRQEFITWWKEEVPSFSEMNYGLENLEKHGNKVDYIITHTGPTKAVNAVFKYYDTHDDEFAIARSNDPVSKFLSEVERITEFKTWFFGHLHDELVIEDKFMCTYENIIQIID
jgi:DNA repair exonuclease SbcCD nuclease subunit